MKLGGKGGMVVTNTAGVALALLGLATIAAADGGDATVLYACVKKHGEIAVVQPGAPCKPNETAQRWDLESPTGPKENAGRSAGIEELNGRPCTTPGGPAGMIIEIRYYGTRSAPTLRCRVPGGRFIDHGDQTITDTQTGFTWEKKVAGGNWSATCLTEPHGVGSARTWDQATDEWLDMLNGWCDACAAEGGFAGYNDWRLPTLAELLTIVDASRIPAIDSAFGETDGRDYWSSSLDDAVGPPAAMAVNFLAGGAVHFAKTYPIHVRAVRGP